MNELKILIEQKLCNKDMNDLDKLINEYEIKYPYDLDLYTIKADYCLNIGDANKALKYATEGLRINPCNAEMYYNIAIVMEELCDYEGACDNYFKASTLFEFINQKQMAEQSYNSVERILANLNNIIENTADLNLHEELRKTINSIGENIEIGSKLFSLRFTSSNQLINTIYNDGKGKEYYISHYNNWLRKNGSNNNPSKDLISCKGEFIEISSVSNFYESNEECDILLPLFYNKQNNEYNTYKLYTESESYNISFFPEHFNYLRLPGNIKIEAKFNAVIGKPILLKQDPLKKKLVLNIFMDGLPQIFVNSPDFNEYMPNTKDFFSKGIIFNNVFADAEWTYPSVATLFSGLKASNHMMIHPNIGIPLPKDIKLISEYFKDAGYYTGKIDGDWRSTPNYGYLRGINRFLYQNQTNGSTYYETIQDTIEHLEMSSETNQFLWICIGDLHDVADEFDFPPSIQAKASIKDINGMIGSTTSVKQQYNEHKINLFKLYAKRIDLAISSLYRYIEQNYKDDEIVISLFSDHGQGYMVKESEHFFAPARSNTALMIRSSYKQGTICDEYISTCDYIEIIGKLSNIPVISTIDSNLPKYLGGLKERKYVFSQCLHAGDCYKAAFHSKEYSCYIQTQDIIDYDGRFDLNEYTVTILDNDNNKVNDENIRNYYLAELKRYIAHLQHY